MIRVSSVRLTLPSSEFFISWTISINASGVTMIPTGNCDHSFYFFFVTCDLRICSCLACVYRVMDARRKFGQHERCVRVARGAAEGNPSFLNALQSFQVHP